MYMVVVYNMNDMSSSLKCLTDNLKTAETMLIHYKILLIHMN